MAATARIFRHVKGKYDKNYIICFLSKNRMKVLVRSEGTMGISEQIKVMIEKLCFFFSPLDGIQSPQ